MTAGAGYMHVRRGQDCQAASGARHALAQYRASQTTPIVWLSTAHRVAHR